MRYDADNHLYYTDDMTPVKSVTQILKDNNLGPNYDEIKKRDPDALEYARNRGECVNKAVDLYDNCSLNIDDLNSEIKLYLDQWILFKKEYEVEVIDSQRIVYNEEHAYCGTYDKKCYMKRIKDTCIIELKCTSSRPKSHRWQAAAYRMADKADSAIVLYLTKEKFKVYEVLPEHEEIFLAAALLSKVRGNR